LRARSRNYTLGCNFMQGRKPKPVALKLVTGNPGRRPLPEQKPTDAKAPSGEPDDAPVRPKYLKGKRALEIWDEVLEFAFWLVIADSYKLAAWCNDQADFERNGKRWATTAKRAHWSLASDLGLDPASRARLGGGGGGRKPKDPAEDHFS
jgi:phage terminase small subunit